jgi:nicotinamide/nicotinate riboside kinase
MICAFHASQIVIETRLSTHLLPESLQMKVVFIGLSGPSSSGKTTFAYLLKQIFPDVAYILHAGDICKEFDEIPTVNGYLDCDGPDAIDYARMANILDHMRGHIGLPPEDFKSWQDEVFPGQEEKSLLTVPKEVVDNLRDQVFTEENLNLKSIKLVLVDGFLLYQNPAVRERHDVKLFFRLSHKIAKERRFTRQGYGSESNPDEFWKTENYVEKMAWRSYMEQHAFIFERGGVDGGVDEVACERAGIKVQPGLNPPIMESLVWSLQNNFQPSVYDVTQVGCSSICRTREAGR